MLKINFTKRAEKFLGQLPAKQARQLGTKIAALRVDPNPPDARPLKGFPYMRCDAGEYRVIFSVESDTLMIFLVGKRNDDEVYRILKRS